MKKKAFLVIAVFILSVTSCDWLSGLLCDPSDISPPTITTTIPPTTTTTIPPTTTTTIPPTTTTTIPPTTTTTIPPTTTTTIPPTTTTTIPQPKTTTPSGLKISGSTRSSIALAWNLVSDNGGINSYKVYRATSKEGVYECLNYPGTVNASSYADTSLSPGQIRFYKVQAFNGSTKDSAFSEPVSFTTLPASVPSFKQNNLNWSGEPMGSSLYKIGNYGCVTTCIAMGLSYYGYATDPKQLNSWIVSKNGYSDGFLNFNVISSWDNNRISLATHSDWTSEAADMSIIDSYLAKDVPVLVKVELASAPSTGYKYHWVLITEKTSGIYKINDPVFSGAQLNGNSNFLYTNNLPRAIYAAVAYERVF